MNNTAELMRLQNGDVFAGYLRVQKADELKDKNGKTYFALSLGDRSGAINAKVWDAATLELPKQGSVIRVFRGLAQEFKGNLQLRVDNFRPANDTDEIDLTELVATSPEPSDRMMAELEATIAEMTNPTLKALVTAMLKQVRDKLLYYPAAQMMHHVEHGGLLHHTLSMLRVAKALIPCYPRLNRDLLLSGVIVHDFGKTIELSSDETGAPQGYTKDGLLFGHLLRGFQMLSKAAQAVGLSEDDEMLMLLQHMMISHHGDIQYGSIRFPMFPEAEMLHFIDNLDARMNEFEAIMDQVTPGSFSDKKSFLDNRCLYHPRYPEGA